MALVGGCLSRMCGGGLVRLPWGLDQWLYAAPYAWCGPVGYLGAVLGKRTGHRGYISLGDMPDAIAGSNALDWLVCGRGYWRAVMGLAVTGVAVTLGAGIISGSWLLALSGALKAPAYMLGRLWDRTTASGEFLTGYFGWGSFGLIIFSSG